MIAGIGTDIVEVERVERALKRFGEIFLDRIFSSREQGNFASHSAPGPHCAGRWAAKEAVAKALGCGIGASCAFKEVEILNDVATGEPRVELHGSAAAHFARGGGGRILISISHERSYATATAVWER